MNLSPINSNVIFTFVDRVNSNGLFEKAPTASGILLSPSFDDSAKEPRWINILAVGPRCTAVKVGQQALVRNLRWTPYFKVDGNKMWRTEESEIVAVRQSSDAKIQPLSTTVLFTKRANTSKSTGLLYVIGNDSNTPSGVVVDVGPSVATELTPNCIIYYNDTNFTDTFMHQNQQLAFVRDDEVIAYEPSKE